MGYCFIDEKGKYRKVSRIFIEVVSLGYFIFLLGFLVSGILMQKVLFEETFTQAKIETNKMLKVYVGSNDRFKHD